jgi:hypothetical protein
MAQGASAGAAAGPGLAASIADDRDEGEDLGNEAPGGRLL